MRNLMDQINKLRKRTDIQKVLSLPHDTLVSVGGKQFRLLDKAYVIGTPDDYAVAFKQSAPEKLKGLSIAFDALNYG